MAGGRHGGDGDAPPAKATLLHRGQLRHDSLDEVWPASTGFLTNLHSLLLRLLWLYELAFPLPPALGSGVSEASMVPAMLAEAPPAWASEWAGCGRCPGTAGALES